MRPFIFLGLITGVYSVIIVFIIIKENLIDFIDAHYEAVDYIKNGPLKD